MMKILYYSCQEADIHRFPIDPIFQSNLVAADSLLDLFEMPFNHKKTFCL